MGEFIKVSLIVTVLVGIISIGIPKTVNKEKQKDKIVKKKKRSRKLKHADDFWGLQSNAATFLNIAVSLEEISETLKQIKEQNEN